MCMKTHSMILDIFYSCTYHSYVTVYVYNPFICSILIQFREDKFFHTKYNTILSFNAHNCPKPNVITKKYDSHIKTWLYLLTDW